MDRFHRIWTSPFIAAAVIRGHWWAHLESKTAAQRASDEARIALFTARMTAADLHTDIKHFRRQQ